MFLILKPFTIKREEYFDSKISYIRWNNGAVSLGMFIFMFGEYWIGDEETKAHEYGHSIQSKILGPLYLLVIGLPSIIWAAFIYRFTKKSYFWFYTEAWANKLVNLHIQ